MIIITDANGNVVKSIPDIVYQGSNNANDIILLAPFASSVQVAIAFKLPNGILTEEKMMTKYDGVIDKYPNLNGWFFSIDQSLTDLYGTLDFQFRVYTNAYKMPITKAVVNEDAEEFSADWLKNTSGEIIVAQIGTLYVLENGKQYLWNGGSYYQTQNQNIVASFGSSLEIVKGVKPILPALPTQSIYEQILVALSAIDGDIEDIMAILETKQDKYDLSLDTTSKYVVGAINELKEAIEDVDVKVDDVTISKNANGELQAIGITDGDEVVDVDDIKDIQTNISTLESTKQNKTDNSLSTTSKTVVGAINELKSAIDDVDVSIDGTTITRNDDDELQAVALKNKGLRVTETAIVDGDFDGITYFESDVDFMQFVEDGYIEKGGVQIEYDENAYYLTPSVTSGIIISLSGTSGTLTDDQYSKLIGSLANSALILGNRIYRYNEKLENSISFSNVVYPTTTTQEIKVIYVNTSSEAVNYKHWNVESEDIIPTEEVINIGNGQTLIESMVYPTLTKAKADEIYEKYTAGKEIALLWQPMSIDTYFSVVYASEISGYEIDLVAHGKVVKYSWTSSTTEDIEPTISGSSGGTQLYRHTLTTSNAIVTFVAEYDTVISSVGEISTDFNIVLQVGGSSPVPTPPTPNAPCYTVIKKPSVSSFSGVTFTYIDDNNTLQTVTISSINSDVVTPL